MRVMVNPKEFLKEKHKEGCMFLKEEYLDALPTDWFDAVMFIFTNGIDQNKNSHTVIMDDEMTERLNKILSMKQAPIFIISDRLIDGQSYVWNVAIAKEINEENPDNPDPKKIFIGGEEFRKYCDEKNIFYRSFLTEEGLLISSSNLQYEKKHGEDCRNPLNGTN